MCGVDSSLNEAIMNMKLDQYETDVAGVFDGVRDHILKHQPDFDLYETDWDKDNAKEAYQLFLEKLDKEKYTLDKTQIKKLLLFGDILKAYADGEME